MFYTYYREFGIYCSRFYGMVGKGTIHNTAQETDAPRISTVETLRFKGTFTIIVVSIVLSS